MWNSAACYFLNTFSTLWKRFLGYFDICWTMIRVFGRVEGKVISASGKVNSFNWRLIQCASNDNFCLWLMEIPPKSYFFLRYIRLQQVAFNSHSRHNKCLQLLCKTAFVSFSTNVLLQLLRHGVSKVSQFGILYHSFFFFFPLCN